MFEATELEEAHYQNALTGQADEEGDDISLSNVQNKLMESENILALNLSSGDEEAVLVNAINENTIKEKEQEANFCCSVLYCNKDVYDTCKGCSHCFFPKNCFCQDHILNHALVVADDRVVEMEDSFKNNITEVIDETEVEESIKLFERISQLKIVIRFSIIYYLKKIFIIFF